MNFIKKFFISFFALLALFIICLFFLVIAANRGHLNKQIKEIAEFYLSKTDVKAVIEDLQFQDNKLFISKAHFGMAGDSRGEITNLNVSFDFVKPEIVGKANINNFSIISNNEQEILNTQISIEQTINFAKNKFEIISNLNDIKSVILSDPNGANLPLGQGLCEYKARLFNANAKKEFDCKVTFGSSALMSFKSLIHKNIEAHSNINNIPISIYQIVQKILPKNEVILYLQEHIKSGYIENGEFDLMINKKLLSSGVFPEDAVHGKFHVTNLEYKYDVDFPALTDTDTNITINGPIIKFIINKAYSGNSLLSNGSVDFKWEGFEKSNFIFKADAKGEVLDLIDFIAEDSMQNIKSQGIDLKKATGNAESKIEIKIPLSPDIKNSYNISAKLEKVNLKAFSNNITLQNADAEGVYNGSKIIFTGKGKINNYPSNFIYEHNMQDDHKDDYDCLLNVKSTLSFKDKKIGILKILSGSSLLNFEYKKRKNAADTISINSNLDKLEFYLDKISIHKPRYKKANFTLNGTLNDALEGQFDFSLLGEDNLKIIGNLATKDDKYHLNFPSIKYAGTNLKGTLLLDKNNFKAHLTGPSLDLSKASMIQFMEKEGSAINTDVKITANYVKLKNNIALTDLQLEMKCNKVRCSSGFLISTLKSRPLTMRLLVHEKFEQWLIACEDAGALLKAIGLYTDMKGGVLNLALNTKRQEANKGEIIPILDGTFILKHFAVTDTPFLTRIVSFVSLPGLLSSIVNNKDIAFSRMGGKFNYRGDILTLLDSSATGPFFDFTMQGQIDTKKQQINLKGNVVPSFFFISSIITKIPVLGKVFSKVAPYSVELKYKE